jgi:hypothetical protein
MQVFNNAGIVAELIRNSTYIKHRRVNDYRVIHTRQLDDLKITLNVLGDVNGAIDCSFTFARNGLFSVEFCIHLTTRKHKSDEAHCWHGIQVDDMIGFFIHDEDMSKVEYKVKYPKTAKPEAIDEYLMRLVLITS